MDESHLLHRQVSELTDRCIALGAEVKRLREALREIRDGRKPQVCEEYETCQHDGCRASYEAWVIASEILKEVE